MIEISGDYKNRVIQMFGDYGKSWLDKLPDIIDKYIKEFDLKDVKLISNLTYNVLFFAKSDTYGDVVLKVELPFKELTERESMALILSNGIGACKCYYANVDDGIILMERLFPGNTLSEENDLDTRIKVCMEVAKKFNIKVGNDTNLPKYRDILNRSIDIIGKNERYDVGEFLEVADNLYSEIEEENDSNYLIHSDLYSDNVLMSNHGWKVIDPHGFIGDKVLDTAMFIQKELEANGFNEDNIDHIIDEITKYTDDSKEKILKTLIVNYILNMCWDIEVNLGDEVVNREIERSKLLINHYNKNYRDSKVYSKKRNTNN